MARRIADPQDVDPLSAMPDLGVPPGLARDMAAYLYRISPPRGERRQAEAPDPAGD